MYYVNGVGYVYDQFQKDDINYSSNWLDSLSEEELADFGAFKKPEYDSATEVLETTEDGWVVREKTQEELKPPTPPPPYNQLTEVLEATEDGWVVREKTQEELQQTQKQRLSVAWISADNLSKQLDYNSRTSILYLSNDPEIPSWRKERISSIYSWWDNIWEEYERVKNIIINNKEGEFEVSNVGNLPYTIWQIKYE